MLAILVDIMIIVRLICRTSSLKGGVQRFSFRLCFDVALSIVTIGAGQDGEMWGWHVNIIQSFLLALRQRPLRLQESVERIRLSISQFGAIAQSSMH